MPAPRATIHHNSQRKSREHNAPGLQCLMVSLKLFFGGEEIGHDGSSFFCAKGYLRQRATPS